LKKPFFLIDRIIKTTKIKTRGHALSPPVFWLVFHAGLLAALGLSILAAGPVSISADFFDILPNSRFRKSVAAADRFLGDINGRNVYILAGSADFDEAKRGAEALYGLFAGDSGGKGGERDGVFETLSLYAGENTLGEFTDFLFRYRYVLMDESTRDLLENGGAEDIAGSALAEAYGPVNFSSLDYIDLDPFFLVDRGIKTTLLPLLLSGDSGGNLSPRDGVLAAQDGELWYVLIRGRLESGGLALTNKNSAVKKIYAACDLASAENPGLRFVYSGVPFHSYESSSGAQREISLISTITLIIIICLFVCVFRSVIPVFVSLSAVLVSILTALVSALLFFREVHILTLVFGTTLIGTCVDYSVHYFFHWKYNGELKTGTDIRSRIIKSVSLSCVSSLVCFTVLLFAPFVILKQFAVFSLAGLLSSFLSVTCLYPLIKKKEVAGKINREPHEQKRDFGQNIRVAHACPGLRQAQQPRSRRVVGKEPVPKLIDCALARMVLGLALAVFQAFRLAQLRMSRLLSQNFSFGKASSVCLLAMIAVSLTLIFINRKQVRLENNIAALYTMSASLLESEKTSARVLNHGSSSWYFIVSGASPEETLEREEALRAFLDAETARGNLGSYLAVSLFIPSTARQERNFRAAGNLLPLADSQFAALGFPPEAVEEFRRDFASARGRYLLPGEEIPGILRELVSSLWIGALPGEMDGRYYSCVLPRHVKNAETFRAAAFDGVFLVNKVEDIGNELDALTKNMLLLFLAAYACIAVMVKLFYSWSKTLRICLVPFLLILVTLAVLVCADIALSFFPAVGLVLVFGLGLDYMFYITENEKSRGIGGGDIAIQAVHLSFATTALSFGALALSGFTPVHTFGLTVFAGLSAAYVSAMLLTGGRASAGQAKS
jgi:predicted exporter